MRKTFHKRRLFDEDSSWIPVKSRPFVLKYPTLQQKPREEESHDLTGRIREVDTDAKGLDKAYQQGDGFENDNKLFIAGSHTARDWFDDVTKIPQWQDAPGANYLTPVLNSWWGQRIFGTSALRQSERYQKAYEFIEKRGNRHLSMTQIRRIRRSAATEGSPREELQDGHLRSPSVGPSRVRQSEARARERFAIQQQG